jgi:hypothetical protein
MRKKQAQKVDIKTGNISGSGTINIAGHDINVIQPPPLPTASAFFTIEAPPADFTGREDELQQLLSAFDQSHSALLCGLTGSGGIGKTVLARLAAQKLAGASPSAVKTSAAFRNCPLIYIYPIFGTLIAFLVMINRQQEVKFPEQA